MSLSSLMACNAGIARANLPKLQIGGASERSFALATRLTMLATELVPGDDGPGFMDNKLNFISFTPGTSFNMGTPAANAGRGRFCSISWLRTLRAARP